MRLEGCLLHMIHRLRLSVNAPYTQIGMFLLLLLPSSLSLHCSPHIRIIILPQHSLPYPLIHTPNPPLPLLPPRLNNPPPRLPMRQRPQTLRNPLPRIRHQPQTPTQSLTNQTPTALRHALNSPPRSFLRQSLRGLPCQVSETTADAEREVFACDYRARFPVGYAAVGGDFGAPEAGQGAEAFGCGEGHVDEDAFGVGGEEFAEGFAGCEGH